MVRHVVALQPMEVNSGADIHLQPMENLMLEQVDVPEGGCGPCGEPVLKQGPGRTCGPVEKGAHAGADLLAGLVTVWDTHTRAICS
ncbi:hypothetical protein llap_5684 [Limosa lapponica baueri]|uniref:Uncharacterized protein n=1 Tax=Limosa lapponica baueri TaxID=1758121 RepID=A0A2I0UDD4_LIMLA|nr:hypothetical protein llap_5684 [Limosa lapponica baueri]